MNQPGKRRDSTLWTRLPQGSEASAGYDLAGNILVGLGLGWLAQHFFPGLKPWGFVAGIVLGSVSGFYQLFRQQGRRKGQDQKPAQTQGDRDHAPLD